MAKRSFKTHNSSDVPPLLHVKDLTNPIPLPPTGDPWIGSPSFPELTRSSIVVSDDARYLAWILLGRELKILDCKARHQPVLAHSRLGSDGEFDENGIQELSPQTTTILCKKLVLSVAFGKLRGESIRKCARPISIGFHKVLNFPSESGHIVATGYERGEIDLWQVDTRTRLISLVDHKDDVRNLQFAPNGSLLLLSSSKDESIKIWDCQDDGNLLKTIQPDQCLQRMAPVIAWAPDASQFAAGLGNCVYAWDVADISVHNRKCPVVRQFKGHQNAVTAIAYSNDGTFMLSGGNDCLVILWDATSSHYPLDADFHAAAPSPMSSTAAMLRIFRSVYPCSSRFEMSLIGGPLEDFAVRDVAFAPGADHITAVCGDGSVRVWSILDDDDDPIATAFVDRPVGCAFLGGGGFSSIAVGLADGTVKLFRQPTVKMLSLQHLARKSFWRRRRSSIVDFLNMPKSISAFLKMEDFKSRLGDCDCESQQHQRRVAP